jgi:2-polyprenyl-3-methyl-5-hydroxy-6-metoxy-1,4-benzoquinol methylase
VKNMACKCCDGKDFSKAIETDGGLYFTCAGCGTSYQEASITDASDVETKFEQAQEHFYGDDSVMLAPGFEILQAEATERRLRVVSRYMQSGHLFEVGPGNGMTLAYFKKHGFEVDAIEHSPTLAKSIAEKFNTSVLSGDFNTISETRCYDAYMSFHVIEHVPNFLHHLTKAAAITKKGGFAFIATPNSRSLEHQVCGGRAPNFSTAHLHLFSQQGLRLALKRTGWEIVHTETPEYPMSWLRVFTTALRAMKGKDNALRRGGYAASISPRMIQMIRVFAILTWPFRKLQEQLKLGEELFIVARKL